MGLVLRELGLDVSFELLGDCGLVFLELSAQALVLLASGLKDTA
jgi:hypothetical protein